MVEETERMWAVEEAEGREVAVAAKQGAECGAAIGGLQSRGQRGRHWRQQWW